MSGPRVPRATAFAPASVGNVGVGFDILGFAVDVLGDHVVARATDAPGVSISAIRGVVGDLPLDAAQNTAGRAVQALLAAAPQPFGIALEIEKGIPLGSGLGGSAASAVGAVVAANGLLQKPFEQLDLLKFAMQGEAVASGSLHVDNIAPSLYGGLVLTVGVDNPRVKKIPPPRGVRAVVVHPHLYVATRDARSVLSRTIDMSDFVWQTANLAGFISGCFTDDLDMIRDSFEDVIIEKQRRSMIPGFADVRGAAMAQGALGCSISGAGPSIFAWTLAEAAEGVLAAMKAQFAARQIEVDGWIVDIDSAGARLLPEA
ncbi:MAG: homoserine kinase [Hyphomonadaceae bacterium]